MENYWFWLWAGFGLVGAVIARSKPNKFMFDDQIKLTIYSVLNAFLMPVWGGPIYLIYVLITPEKQICMNCGKISRAEEVICPHCSKSIELSRSEYETATTWQEKQQLQNPELAMGNTKYILVAFILLLIFVPLLTFVWWYIFSKLSEFRFAVFENIEYKLIPDSDTWLVPAFFIAIISSFLPTTWISKLIYKAKLDEYDAYQNLLYPNNVKSLCVKLGIAFLLVFGITVFLIMDSYVLAYDDKIIINSLLGIGKTEYSYKEISSIRSSYQLKQAEWDHPIYVINFRNGDRWSTRWVSSENAQQANNLVIFVARQSSMPIQAIPVFSDSDVQ